MYIKIYEKAETKTRTFEQLPTKKQGFKNENKLKSRDKISFKWQFFLKRLSTIILRQRRFAKHYPY